jgi:hypothetical protein
MEINEYIKRNFYYNHETGIITRFDRKNSNGSKDHYGYIILKIKGVQYKAHRVAWFLHYGTFPLNNIDHINRVRDDNRISNLRDVTQAENIRNSTKKPNKDTGEYGVFLDKTKGLKKKYGLRHKGKLYRFYSIEEAIKFRIKNKIYYGKLNKSN